MGGSGDEEQRSGGVQGVTRWDASASPSVRGPRPGGLEKSQRRIEPRGVTRTFVGGDRAVHDAVSVRDLQRVEHLLGEPQRRRLAHRPLGRDELADRPSVDPRANDERLPFVVRSVGNHGDDTGVLEAAGRVGGAHELTLGALVLSQRPQEHTEHAARRTVVRTARRFVRRRRRTYPEEPLDAPPLEREPDLLLGHAPPLVVPRRLCVREGERGSQLLAQQRVRRLIVRLPARRGVAHDARSLAREARAVRSVARGVPITIRSSRSRRRRAPYRRASPPR